MPRERHYCLWLRVIGRREADMFIAAGLGRKNEDRFKQERCT